MQSAQRVLADNASLLDRLNVFPVADGDTGRNMLVTVQGAVEAMRGHAAGSVNRLMHEAAEGALMAARGNSGVILSQIFRGMAQASADCRVLEPRDLHRAFVQAAQCARQHVVHPQEGTILSVADAVATSVDTGGDLIQALQTGLAGGERALSETTHILPALAHTELVDAGALGYISILRGWLAAALNDLPVRSDLSLNILSNPVAGKHFSSPPTANYYDVEVLLHNLRGPDFQTVLAERLPHVGDSIVVAPGHDMVKVHVHTHQPLALMQLLIEVGDIRQMEWMDMRPQVLEHRGAETLAIVAPSELHPLFSGLYPTRTPGEAQDDPDTLWVAPDRPLEVGLAAPSIGLAGQVMLEYVPGDTWAINKARLKEYLAGMKSWRIDRSQGRYVFDNVSYASRGTLRRALKPLLMDAGIITVYLSHAARREEAVFWQDAFSAELVQVPLDHPWMEIVWQP